MKLKIVRNNGDWEYVSCIKYDWALISIATVGVSGKTIFGIYYPSDYLSTSYDCSNWYMLVHKKIFDFVEDGILI